MGMGGIQSNHLFFNLHYYVTPTVLMFPEKSVYIIRTEHLWQDLTQLEQFFSSSSSHLDAHGDNNDHAGGAGVTIDDNSNNNIDDNSNIKQGLFDEMKGYKVSHGSESYNKTVISSPRHVQNLCCGLMDELLLYRYLLEKAVNLNSFEKLKTWKRAVGICTSSSTKNNNHNDDDDNHRGAYELLWENLVQECTKVRSAARVAPAIIAPQRQRQ